MADLDSYILHNLQCFPHDNYLVCLPFSVLDSSDLARLCHLAESRYKEGFRNVYDIVYTIYYL